MSTRICRLALSVCLAVCASSSHAFEHRTQVSIGADADTQTVAVAWNPYWRCCGVEWVRIGTGLRFSAFRGQGITLETAEHDFINRDQTSVLTEVDPQILAYNGFISLDIVPSEWLVVGFNLDLLGGSLGPTQTGQYAENGFERTASLHPTALNVLLGDTRDIGTLNSEFFLATPINEHWGSRAGFSHFFAEMQSSNALKHGGRRFRTIRNLGMLSATYRH